MDSKESPAMQLSDRFGDALLYAYALHANQRRKGTQIPYIAHLLCVTALVLEAGGGEDEAIAALLHDAVEDQGGQGTFEEIRVKYGHHVADMVAELTDSWEDPKPPWQERKEQYLKHLWEVSPEVRKISLADKLHNARSILYALREEGETTWEKFHGGKNGTLWYYKSLASFFAATGDDQMTQDLTQVVAEIKKLACQNSELDK